MKPGPGPALATFAGLGLGWVLFKIVMAVIS